MVKTSCFHIGGTISIPDQGTKIPQASRPKKKKGHLSRLSGWGLGGGLLAVVRNFVWLLITGIWNNGLNKIEDIFSFFFLLHLSLPLPFLLPICPSLPFRETEGSPGQVWRLTITRDLGSLPLSSLLGPPYHIVSFLVVTSWEKMELSHYLHITDSCLSPGRNLLRVLTNNSCSHFISWTISHMVTPRCQMG